MTYLSSVDAIEDIRRAYDRSSSFSKFKKLFTQTDFVRWLQRGKINPIPIQSFEEIHSNGVYLANTVMCRNMGAFTSWNKKHVFYELMGGEDISYEYFKSIVPCTTETHIRVSSFDSDEAFYLESLIWNPEEPFRL